MTITRKTITEDSQYLVLVLIVAGQAATDPIIGQAAFLSANSLSTARCFALGRPRSDKVKDVVLALITLGLLLSHLL